MDLHDISERLKRVFTVPRKPEREIDALLARLWEKLPHENKEDRR